MTTTPFRRSAARSPSSSGQQIERSMELSQEVVEHLTDYARRNPGYAALWCLGVGFVLGWKLKPW